VPQCYDKDPRLGRWVHYQRVEYWIYQQTGKFYGKSNEVDYRKHNKQLMLVVAPANGKITPDRIRRLEAIGFEWDPQRAQWNIMLKKLTAFKDETGHCKVPKVISNLLFFKDSVIFLLTNHPFLGLP